MKTKNLKKKKPNSMACSPQANYTDRTLMKPSKFYMDN
jgi:hypothetical protein